MDDTVPSMVNLRRVPFLHLLLVCFALSLLVSCADSGAGSTATEKAAGAERVTKGAADNPNATDTRNLLESRESPYNNVYVYRTGTNLSMTFGYNQKIYTESVYNTLDERDLPVPYTRFMTAALLYPKKINSVLEIGSGGGRVAWYLHKFLPNTAITTVELDPTVVELAHKYFGIREEPNFHIVTRDGRLFLAGSKMKYDVILIDAYRGPFVPFHMLTKEFYKIVEQHLADGGVVAQNIEPATMLFDSDVNTLHEVFSQIEFYDASGSTTGGNVVMMAYNDQAHSVSELSGQAEKLQSTYKLRYDLGQMLAHRFGLKTVMVGQKTTFDVVDQSGKSTAGINENAKVLTDDFAPVESLKAIEKHNTKWTATSQ